MTATNKASSLLNFPSSPKSRRRSSSIISHVELESDEEINDQNALPNLNATWVHTKGAWLIHICMIVFLKAFFNVLPGSSPELSWTLTNASYVISTYIMFHQIKGTPFDFNSGAYDNLTMWEQIDNGDQYTPSKKFLFLVPIALFLVSTHYANYNLNFFILNGLLCLVGCVSKLPFTHRLRISIPFITNPWAPDFCRATLEYYKIIFENIHCTHTFILYILLALARSKQVDHKQFSTLPFGFDWLATHIEKRHLIYKWFFEMKRLIPGQIQIRVSTYTYTYTFTQHRSVRFVSPTLFIYFCLFNFSL